MPTIRLGLSSKLLVLTIVFVMLAEVLIFAPSVARYRQVWLNERMAEAHLAALTIEAAPEGMVSAALEQKLLDRVGAHVIDLSYPDRRVYMLSDGRQPAAAAHYDLGRADVAALILDAFAVLARRTPRTIAVEGPSPKDPEARVRLLLPEAPLQRETRNFAWRILGLSIVISLITAGLVFLSLHYLFVRPMRRITRSMTAFHDDPEDPDAILVPSARGDEIGVAQRELARMQAAVRQALRQKERLAALGTAVAKINHDLRNILSTASLVSERLAASADPQVVRVTPRLMTAIDRAVDLCAQTLSYTRDGVVPLRRSSVDLRGLVEEVGSEVLVAAGQGDDEQGADAAVRWDNRVPAAVTALVDQDQLYRALLNLGRNAAQAGADRVTVEAETAPGRLTLVMTDTGPGLPPRSVAHLFQPFAGSSRTDGAGLGLAIAREIVRAHGGDLRLRSTGSGGTVFALELPAAGMSS